MLSASFYAWKAKYGGMDVAGAQKLKGLEAENAKLTRLSADAMLDNAALQSSCARGSVWKLTAGELLIRCEHASAPGLHQRRLW